MQKKEVSPKKVLDQVATSIPEDVKKNIIIVGSLAAAYWLFKEKASLGVRTKDIDCVLSPFIHAVEAGKSIAVKLLANGWTAKTEGRYGEPGNEKTEINRLPAVRLFPPGSQDWFLELQTEPENKEQADLKWTRLEFDSGDHYGLPSFPFIKVAIHNAKMTDIGIRCALPEMMMLANLLEHPKVKPGLTHDLGIKRSNKDLGRVLAIARLSDESSWEQWPQLWSDALRICYPERWQALSSTLGNGLQEMLNSPFDLQQAVNACADSLLARFGVNAQQLKNIGERLLVFTIDKVKELGNS